MPVKINKLLLQTSKDNKFNKKESSRIIFSRDIVRDESKLLPELFCLIEINTASLTPEDYVDAIILLDKIELKIIERTQKIYNSITERKNFQTEDISAQLLELLLKTLNGEIRYVFEEKGPFISLRKSINILIGIIEPLASKKENKYNFHFSYLNTIKNILIYKQGDKYSHMDISETAGNEDENGNDKKIFNNIISGELEPSSFLIICSQTLIDYIIPDKLKQIVISMDINEAAKQTKRLLTEINVDDIYGEGLNFAAIFVYLTEEKEKQLLQPENSIERLITTEKNTEKFLSPSFIPDFSKHLKNLASFFKRNYKKYQLKFKTKISIIKNKTSLPKKENRTQYTKNAIGKMSNYIFKRIKNVKKITIKVFYLTIACLKKTLNIIALVATGILSYIIKTIRAIKNSSIKRKTLMIFFLLSIILFFKGISWMNNKNINEQNEIAYNQTLDEINKKMNSLEASLIYGDIKKAEKIITEIDILMKTGISKNEEQSAQKYNELKTTLADYNKKINKVIEISNPEQLDADFNDFSNNIINKNLSELNQQDETIIQLRKNLINGEIADAKYYADNVYVLDAKNNQIYVYRNATRQNWLKEANVYLKDAISMAIDGNIFILKGDGEILKLFKGRKENFSLQDINPPISAPAKIDTDADFKYLYILDPPNKRILVFEKECSQEKCGLIAQYTSQRFNDLQDFAVDEKNNLMYVLNQGIVYKINLQAP